MPDASAVLVAIVVLPFIKVTVAPGNGCGVAQVWSAQATIDPLIVKPVTVSDTEIVWGLPKTAAPVLSVALMVIVPLYVPGAIFAGGLTLTPSVLPLPLSVPDAGERTSQALLPASPVAVHETGRAQVPISLKLTFCAAGADCPWETENERLAGEGDDSVQGGKTVSVTERVCGLPCTTAPELSVAEMVTCVLYVPGTKPAILAATPILSA